MHYVTYLLLLLCLLPGSLFAAEEIIADDGREVQLNDDGSWSYTSTDRFATSAAGKRIRLKADGSWVYTGDETAVGLQLISDRKYVAEQFLQVSLRELVLDTARGKKSESHKNSPKQTQMVFYLSIHMDQKAKGSVDIGFNTADFSVQDSDGRNYPVILVVPATATLQPGGETEVIVRADGSPHWWTTKSMSLTLAKSVFSSQQELVLTRSMATVKKRKVDDL